MLVYKLCQQSCPDKIPPLGIRLGDGADGEVFELENDPSKVIKLCVLFKCQHEEVDLEFINISQVLSHLINNPIHTHARVYNCVYLGKFSSYILYYYTLEKLYKISEDEKKVFHSIISHEDLGKEKKFSIAKVKKMLKGMSLGLDFDLDKVIFFYDNCRKTQVAHLDIHVRNIMKDAAGNFKLIDFDRAKLLEKNNVKNK